MKGLSLLLSLHLHLFEISTDLSLLIVQGRPFNTAIANLDLFNRTTIDVGLFSALSSLITEFDLVELVISKSRICQSRSSLLT